MPSSTPSQTSILLVKQRHEADRAGLHYDWRVVIGDKAYSWATKKVTPPPRGKLILWEQPVHDRAYALSKTVVIPPGQYGAGTTYLEYAQKGTAKFEHNDYFELNLNNGDRYYIKKMPSYGDKAWLMVNLSGVEKKESGTKNMNKQASSNPPNRYLEKLASLTYSLGKLMGNRGRLYDKASNVYKYRATMTSNPELKAKLLKRVERADIKKALANTDTLKARMFVPESFVEGASKAIPGAAIAALSGYLIGRKKEKDSSESKKGRQLEKTAPVKS